MLFEIILLLLVILLLYKAFTKPDWLPPGEWGLPFIGKIIPFGGYDLKNMIEKLKKKHGEIFYVKCGSHLFLYLTGPSLIRKALEKFEFNGRPDFFSQKIFTLFQNYGIAFSDGPIWQDSRRFTLKNLRDYGYGKSSIEGRIMHEVEAFIDDTKQKVGKPVAIEWSLNIAILNIIWGLMADRRYELYDKELKRFTGIIDENFRMIGGPVCYLNYFPQLSYILPKFVLNKWMEIDKLERNINELIEFMMEIFREHARTIDLANPRDVIDCFLIEKDILINNPDMKFDSDMVSLFSIVDDIFVAGSETTSTTIRFFFLFMSVYQDVQKRAREEVEQVIGLERSGELSDKENLPYLNAVICELHRSISLLPNNLIHCAIEDTTFEGYKIPKGTRIYTCLEMANRNEESWKKPFEFYPEHFLDEDGKFNGKKEGFYPFGHGRRICIGENLANKALFLFTVAILQNFEIFPYPSVEEAKEVIAKPFRSLITMPSPFKVILKKKK